MAHEGFTVIFQHLPKAAGSTVNTILRREYAPADTYHVAGAGGDREERFAHLPDEVRTRIRLLRGHLYFGIHRHVPNPSTYVTLLRDPVERVISHYYFVRRSPGHYLHERVVGSSMTLEEYVTSGMTLELNNGQVRSLFGLEHLDIPYGHCSPKMLELAIHHARRYYTVVGLAERFDESMLLMRRRLAWKSRPLYVRKNVTPMKPKASRVPHTVIRLIERDNELDIALYEAMARTFQSQVEQFDIGSEIARFQRLNRVYAAYSYSARTVRRAVHQWRVGAISASDTSVTIESRP